MISQKKPRICILTARDYIRYAFRSGLYEGEDVLSDIDNVDMVYLKPGKASTIRKNIQKKIIWHDFTGKTALLNLAFKPLKLTKNYDLFIAYLPLIQELVHIPSIKRWKDHCKTSICWIDEIWVADFQKMKPWLSALDQFDHIVIGYKGTVKTAAEVLKRSVHYIPVGVDALRFSPYPRPPNRTIDIYSIGRRREKLHQALLNFADKERMFYIYDTFNASYSEVNDWRQHRELYGNMAKRSHYFIVAPGKINMPEETMGQIEVGFRYYEGASAGAIMIGEAPDCESFRTMFDWPDAVIGVQPDGSDVGEVLSSLAGQPGRLLEISRRNAKEALLRHDWVYRWENILRIGGLEPLPMLLERKKRLGEFAEIAERDGDSVT